MNFFPRIHRSALAIVMMILACVDNAPAEEPREWTNTDGVTITATMLGVDDQGRVLILFRGKETPIALDTLSEADKEYIAQWQEKQKEIEQQRAAQATMFAGKQLKMGGQNNMFTFDYEPDVLQQKESKHEAKDTGYRIAITVPEGFDSRKPQKVFFLANAQNSKGQSRMGNVMAIHNFSETTAAEGWVCIAYDSSLGNDVDHTYAWSQAMKKLAAEWPDFNNWTFACGGNSGGAKGAMLHTAYHVSRGRKVVGLFLSSCNQATNMPLARKHYDVNKNDLRDTRCYASANKTTPKVTPAHMENVLSDIKGAGIRTVRDEWHEGGPGIYQKHFAEALRWFSQENP